MSYLDSDITVERKQLFDTLVDLFSHFITFCNDNELTYYVSGGTLLGTIRHKGFIPWDDDLDIMMPREDYDKMLDIVRRERNSSQYQFINPETDPYYLKAFTRFVNKNTTMIPLKDALYKFNQGCFIDIFPIDRIPDNPKVREVYFRRCSLYWGILLALGRYRSKIGTLGLNVKKKCFYYILFPFFLFKIITPTRLFKSFNAYASRYKSKKEKAKDVGTVMFSGSNPRCIFKPEYIGDVLSMPFESITVSVPKGYDAILSNEYGDYMTPVRQPTEHGDTVFDPNVPYDEYKKQNKDFLASEFFKRKTQSGV